MQVSGLVQRLNGQEVDRVGGQQLLLQPLGAEPGRGEWTRRVPIAHRLDELAFALDPRGDAITSGGQAPRADEAEPLGIRELPAEPEVVLHDAAPHRDGTDDGGCALQDAAGGPQAFEAGHRVQAARAPEVRDLTAEVGRAARAVGLPGDPVERLEQRNELDPVGAVPPEGPGAPADHGVDRQREG